MAGQIDPRLTAPPEALAEFGQDLRRLIQPEKWRLDAQLGFFRMNPEAAQQLAQSARRMMAEGSSRDETLEQISSSLGIKPEVAQAQLNLYPLSVAERTETLELLSGMPQKRLDEALDQMELVGEQRDVALRHIREFGERGGPEEAARREVSEDVLRGRTARARVEIGEPEATALAEVDVARGRSLQARAREQAGAAAFEAAMPEVQLETAQAQQQALYTQIPLDTRYLGLRNEGQRITNELNRLKLQQLGTGEAPFELSMDAFNEGLQVLNGRQSLHQSEWSGILDSVISDPEAEDVFDRSSAKSFIMERNITELGRLAAGKKPGKGERNFIFDWLAADQPDAAMLRRARRTFTNRFITQRSTLTQVNGAKMMINDPQLVPLDDVPDEELLFLDPETLMSAADLGVIVLTDKEMQDLANLVAALGLEEVYPVGFFGGR